MAFFLRHLTDPTSIAEEPSLSKVVQHVRETAVCLAVLGQVDHGTGLLTILHAHGIPPFDLREFGPEGFSEDFGRCRTLGKGFDGNGSSTTHESEEEESAIELWGRTIATLHTAQDQMPMLGSMRELWRYGWFTNPSKNALVKHLDIDLAQIREAADAGCEMLRRRLGHGPERPYEGYTIAELARAIDENARANAPYAPDELRDRGGYAPPLSKVIVQDDELPPSIQLELLPSRDLADGTCITWPLLRRIICISEGGYDGDLWLVEPKYVAEAKDAFFQIYDHASDQDRRLLRREMEEVYGSIDGFRKLEWGLLVWTSWFTEMVPYRDLSALTDELARQIGERWRSGRFSSIQVRGS
ncbi:hypothetical protein CSAL01_04665 [Colletotrichum salicis]|uniref:Uncharacterized protein n=1 Tax=Colletotrichum salicis TaxID=1209931 RepID=A0A135UVY8_9PEZI|nr:hypothetical protein CSAL01_04665 [Colletotrichum salicis]